MCKNADCEPTKKQLEHAIKRNFGGLAELNTFEIFQKHLPKSMKESPPSLVRCKLVYLYCQILVLVFPIEPTVKSRL